MKLVDTHCHIHDPKFGFVVDEVLRSAEKAGVSTMVCVGNDVDDSEIATDFVLQHDNCVATVGVHPHEADRYIDDKHMAERLSELVRKDKVVGIGECGLDYYYSHAERGNQQTLFRKHLELAVQFDKPLVFHVRDAFEDFWKIIDDYQGLRGVIHSFTATRKEMDQTLDRGLYIGLGGIMTFSKDPEHLEVVKAMPIDRLLLETDSPFLTPVPKRGTMNEPANVSLVCEYLAHIRSLSSDSLAATTTQNAQRLFAF